MIETRDSLDPQAAWQPFLAGVRGFVARRVPAADAEDVAQEVFLRLARAAGSLRDAERAEAWVYGIARRAIADFYRARGGIPGAAAAGGALDEAAEAAEVESLADPVAGRTGALAGFGTFAGDHDVHEEVLSWLRPAADELPPRYRDALVLADFEGLTQRQVAERLGLSLSGAKSRVQRARAMLAERLGRCCEIELGPDGRAVDFRRRDCDC